MRIVLKQISMGYINHLRCSSPHPQQLHSQARIDTYLSIIQAAIESPWTTFHIASGLALECLRRQHACRASMYIGRYGLYNGPSPLCFSQHHQAWRTYLYMHQLYQGFSLCSTHRSSPTFMHMDSVIPLSELPDNSYNLVYDCYTWLSNSVIHWR